MIKVPHPIPYQGSKRQLAPDILKCIPSRARRIVEPFAGAAAVSLAALAARKVPLVWLNDLNAPLMELWRALISNPARLSKEYASLWNEQKRDRRAFYDNVRDRFNRDPSPADFLYLLARCVKASVRYNARGEFNQSPDNRRQGARPATMAGHISGASFILRDRTHVTSLDYADVLDQVREDDVVYMDPPYQGVSSSRDARYLMGVRLEELIDQLEVLNRRQIMFILSYDGRTGEKQIGKLLPENLGLTRIELTAGRSTQATLLGRDSTTVESLYLSPGLLRFVDAPTLCERANRPSQLRLFDSIV